MEYKQSALKVTEYIYFKKNNLLQFYWVDDGHIISNA